MASNQLFSARVSPRTSSFSRERVGREYLLSSKTAHELNTYTNFTPFNMFSDAYVPRYIKSGNQWVEDPDVQLLGKGVRSLFNKTGAVMMDSMDVADAGQMRVSNNTPLLDSRENRQKIRDLSKCSVKDLVEASSRGILGREVYSYSDFMYCKWLGRVPNNYLITLRRFPYPVDDYISSTGYDESIRRTKGVVSSNVQDIGCMVTWMGVSGNNLEDILKYSVNMPFKQSQAQWSEAQGGGDVNKGVLNQIAAVFDSKYREQYMLGEAGANANAFFNNTLGMSAIQSGVQSALSKGGVLGRAAGSLIGGVKLGDNPYTVGEFTHADATKVYGPVDAIKTTYQRSDEGLTFNQSFTLTFDYEMRSYNGINGRQAFLDLIANILAVTYTTGTFWGGGYKGTGAHQNNIFANLEIFKTKGGASNFIDALSRDMSNVWGGIKGSMGDGTLKGAWQAIKSALNNLGGMLIGGFLNQLGRPAKTAVNSLLSPAPIGFWHVTIGNPFHPIMSIGNMIIKNATISHTGPLGIDDFPTGIRVTVELERGKTRDSRDIEKLYQLGNSRIYYSMSEKVFDMYRHCKDYKGDAETTYGNYVTGSTDIDASLAQITAAGRRVDGAEVKEMRGLLQKYFGQSDAYSIYVAAAEQEVGSGKKKPSSTNSGEDGRH